MPVSSLLMGSLMGGGGGGGVANMAGGLLGGVVGYFQRRKAKKELAKLQRPTYEIPQEIMRSQRMAEQAANEGMPSQQYNQAAQGIQRQQSRALSAATDRRGGLMALPGLQQQSNDAQLNLDVKDAQARMANQQKLYAINSQTAGYRDKAFEINKMQPYQENKAYYMGLLGQGNQNLYSGAEKFLGGALGGGANGIGLFGQGGGVSRRMTTGRVNKPTYYGGADQNYSEFETGF